MRTGTEFIRLPIILFTMLLLPSYGNGGPTPEDTATDVARKFAIHFLNEEYEEAGEYCLGSVYSYDVMRGFYEHVLLPEIEKYFDDVDDLIDAIDFDSPEVWKYDVDRGSLAHVREAYGVEAVVGAERERITFRRLDVHLQVRTTKHEGVWKVGGGRYWSVACFDKKALRTDEKKRLGIDE